MLRDDEDCFNLKELQEVLGGFSRDRDTGNQQLLPRIRILVVADLDLQSASALAEDTLQRPVAVDLCVACGSFCRDEDLNVYRPNQQLAQRNHHRHQFKQQRQQHWKLFRTREETAALEGLMTAALSQLESIVCRVVYCPGLTDPWTTFLTPHPDQHHLRLTPNSRNVHNQWLPLAPGVGCAALLYVETASGDATLDATVSTPDLDGYYEDSTNEEDDDDLARYWQEQLSQLQQSSKGYYAALEQLLRLGGVVSSQTILVTHHVDLQSNVNSNHDKNAGDDDGDGTEQDFFMESSLVQQWMCLEICSGSSDCAPALIRRGQAQVLLPGSLRQRGEFCILQMALERRHWKVEKVDFHQLKSRT